MYEYLFGIFILACIWVIPFMLRKDLRKAMIWSGLFYIFWTIIGFAIYRVFAFTPDRSITPGYWAPPTLFNLGQRTGGLAIEDVLFMFFVGGIASALYEFIFKDGTRKLSSKEKSKIKKRYAILFAAAGAVLIYLLTQLNGMYSLIAFNLCGGITIMWQRRDLIKHSLMGGVLFLSAYFVMAMIFTHVYPNFIKDYYNLRHTSGVMILGIPLEEYLYGFTFGLLWSPIYEYEYRRKSVKLRSKKLILKKA